MSTPPTSEPLASRSAGFHPLPIPASEAIEIGNPGPVLWFSELGMNDVARAGGKAASLGEMYQALVDRGVRIPNGFATPTNYYREFLNTPVPDGTWADIEVEDHLTQLVGIAAGSTALADALRTLFSHVRLDDAVELHGRTALARAFVLATPVPEVLRSAITGGYDRLCEEYGGVVDTAVRSSATSEDSEMASFAGQYESYLNVRTGDGVVEAWKHCCASAFTERAVSYQLKNGLDPLSGVLAVVVMKMVRSDLATSGVMFTVDPDSGNRNVLLVSSSYGLGELVVQGSVSPDSFLVWKEGLRRGRNALVHRRMGAKDLKLIYSSQGGTATESVDVQSALRRKWSLTRAEVLELGRMGMTIEEHYGRPMDIEWAKDGYSGDLFIVQARPETVHSAGGEGTVLDTFSLDPHLVAGLRKSGEVLVTGSAVGTRIGSGRVRIYDSYEDVIVKKRALRKLVAEGVDLDDLAPEDRVFDPGDVLVTALTTPDWEPLMKDASLIVTERGGRTSHAAIVAREFGIPAIVGCDHATTILESNMEVTGSCAEGEIGVVYRGLHEIHVERVEVGSAAELKTEVKLNVGFPDKALSDARLPSDGVGLARIEFILTAQVGVHPLALLFYEELSHFAETGELAEALEPYRDTLENEATEELKALVGAIARRTPGYGDRREFFVDQVKYGVSLICAAFYPRPVLVRLSDLKSNEYKDLLGGRVFEPDEENPMIAWRGASRYVDPRFRPAFDMELEALQAVRQQIGLDNLQIMVPFCRSPEEGRDVVSILDEWGLSPAAGVPLFLMVELPSNVLDADRFIDEMGLSGGSIGSNDLVQTTYAVSRDDLEHYAYPVEARSPAVKSLIASAVERFSRRGLEIGICGQAPSDHPDEVPPFLVECGITSMSVTPDTLTRVRLAVARAEMPREG